jgi:DNA-binding LacI/PurR family transcriptional regulator
MRAAASWRICCWPAGHQRIGYIAGWEGASTQRDRELGFTTRLAEAGRTLFAREVGNFRMDEAAEAARRMFAVDAGDRPDAVFVANDHMAIPVIDTLRSEFGLRVPDDVSVVGYDDVPAASWPAYSLTTVRQPADRMVEETVDLLLAGRGRRAPPRNVEVKGR